MRHQVSSDNTKIKNPKEMKIGQLFKFTKFPELWMRTDSGFVCLDSGYYTNSLDFERHTAVWYKQIEPLKVALEE